MSRLPEIKTLPKLARYDSASCRECRSPIHQSQLVVGVEYPGLKKLKWVHETCSRDMADKYSGPKAEAGDPGGTRPHSELSEEALVETINRKREELDAAVEKGDFAELGEIAGELSSLQEEKDRRDSGSGSSGDSGEASESPESGPSGAGGESSESEESSNTGDSGDPEEEANEGETEETPPEEPDPEATPPEPEPKPDPDPEKPKAPRGSGKYLQEMVDLAMLRKNIYLVGPAGCGKTYAAGMLASALGMSDRFFSISCTAGMSEAHICGRLLPVGKKGKFEYILSAFVDCYENGGVFLFDEVDAGDENVLIILNQAIETGSDYFPLPARYEKPFARKHPDFIMVAAANTYGTGADRMYVGRLQQDAAFLDRFKIGTIEMDYDTAVEKKRCPDDDLRKRLQRIRLAVRKSELQRIVSTRFLIDAHDMKHKAGWTIEKIEEKLFSGWDKDEVQMVRTAAGL